MRPPASRLLPIVMLLIAACGGTTVEPPPQVPPPYAGTPPLGSAILRTDGTPINDGAGASTGWRWIAFDDAFCNDATVVNGSYVFSTSKTGLAISWGAETNTDVVVFLQGGGACWDFFTCGGGKSLGIDKTVEGTGPFGPSEFSANIYDKYPSSWVHRANLPAALTEATVVFVPYCTGDVHAGNQVTTYSLPPELEFLKLPSITWQHVGHANVMAFLKRLGATFTSPGKMVIAGSSAGGFGTLANYPAFRWYWPDAKGYLVDDSAPPLIGDAIPASTRNAWYASWNAGESLDRFCAGCRTDMSRGLAELSTRYPNDRLALISHTQDLVIRGFFGTISYSPPSLTPMDATAFETQLRLLGTSVMAPTPNARYFFTDLPTADAHTTMENPAQVTAPGAGLAPWLQEMLSDATTWNSAAPVTP